MTEQYEAAALPPEIARRWRRREKRREMMAAAVSPLKLFYWRFIYRAHMKLLHRYGRHGWKMRGHLMSPPMPHWHCDWCGAIDPLDNSNR